MLVVAVLFGSTLLFRALGALGIEAFASWLDAARWGLSAMLVLTASAHFTRMRGDLVAMVPPSFPAPETLVTATGILELLAAAGIQVPETRALAGLGFEVTGPVVVPDGEPVADAIRAAAAAGARVVVTTGGTGLTPTDLTPEVTRPLLDREVPGIAEAIRAPSS